MAFRLSSSDLPISFTRGFLLNNFYAMSVVEGTSPASVYTYFDPRKKGALGKPCIRECNCANMSRYSRSVEVEDPLLEKVKQTYQKTKPLILYSKGSGECYQELSVCVEFAKEGYEVKQIVLTDHKYTTNQLDQPDFTLLTFSTFVKLLFPDVQISVFKYQKEYFDEIKNSKQPKPDIVLCVDVPYMNLQNNKDEYSAMLGSPLNECILAYHNHIDPQSDTETFVDKIQGNKV